MNALNRNDWKRVNTQDLVFINLRWIHTDVNQMKRVAQVINYNNFLASFLYPIGNINRELLSYSIRLNKKPVISFFIDLQPKSVMCDRLTTEMMRRQIWLTELLPWIPYQHCWELWIGFLILLCYIFDHHHHVISIQAAWFLPSSD